MLKTGSKGLGKMASEKTPKKKILLIEDEDLIAEMLAEYFSLVAPEYELQVARTLAEAREKLQGEERDWVLCICDCRLPDGTACELFMERIFHCPIIVTTGFVKDEEIEKVKEYSDQKVYILRKPYLPAELHRKIEEILKS